ncbi:hypothetical protein ABT279_21115 [Amycolatopsis sp. NPDC000673]
MHRRCPSRSRSRARLVAATLGVLLLAGCTWSTDTTSSDSRMDP